MNHWDTTTFNQTAWLWAILYTDLRAMGHTLPTPIHIPYLPTNTTPTQRHHAAHILERARDTHLHNQDLPADIRNLADAAYTGAILAHHATNEEHHELITEAQARTRAVIAYMGIGPEDVGAPDTLEELDL